MITFEYIGAGYSRKTNELLRMLNDPAIQTQINFKIGHALNEFVPMQSGALRASMFADSNGVHWSTPYAHYQYEGVVYAVNHPIWQGGKVTGWYSSGTKYPTDRILGAFKGELPQFPGWTFGYTTDKTMHHWVKMYTGSQWKGGAGEGGIKAKTNLEITKFLKAECRKRGL